MDPKRESVDNFLNLFSNYKNQKKEATMKTQRILFITMGITILLFVISPIASAQNTNVPNFLVWNGTNLRLSTNLKGYYYSPTTVLNLNEYDNKINDNEVQWGVIAGDQDGNFVLAVYSKSPNLDCVPELVLPLQYLAGSQLEFVANFVVNDVDIYASGLVYIKGQLDKTGIAIKPGGTLTVMSAYTIEHGSIVPFDLAANELSIRGTVVKNLGCRLGP